MNDTQLTPARLAKYFDQTLLKAAASDADFAAFCAESARYGFKMVAINSSPVAKCKQYLAGSDVLVGAAIGFPLGQTTIECKLYETKLAITQGADEIDYVVNLGELKSGNFDYIEREMRAIVEACHEAGVTSKVIFENCYLTDDEKRKLCEIACTVGPNFVKTSTGFGTPAAGIAVGATVKDVKLMHSLVAGAKAMSGGPIRVKAAGGVRNLVDALAMIEAGAERIGTSAGVMIVEELKGRSS